MASVRGSSRKRKRNDLDAAGEEDGILIFEAVTSSSSSAPSSSCSTVGEDCLKEVKNEAAASTPVLRRSSRRSFVQEIVDLDASSSVFDTPPASSKKAAKRKSSRQVMTPKARRKKTTTDDDDSAKASTPVKVETRPTSAPATLVTLPDLVQEKLLQFLDVQSMENLSQTCRFYDQMIHGRFITTLNLPFDSQFLQEVTQANIIEKKPVLRLRSKKTGNLKMEEISVSPNAYNLILEQILRPQISVVSLDNLREIDLVPKELPLVGPSAIKTLEAFIWEDKALLRQLSSLNYLSRVTKMDILLDQTVHIQEYLPYFSSLQEVGVTLVGKTGMSEYHFCSMYLANLEQFIERLKAQVLRLDVLSETKRKTMKVFKNDHIEKLVIKGPCTFFVSPVMKNLKEIQVELRAPAAPGCCSYFHSKAEDRELHRLGLCIINMASTYENCPSLKTYNGVDVNVLKGKEKTLQFSVWNYRMKRVFFKEYQKQGGTKDLKAWSRQRWSTKRPLIPQVTGAMRIGHHLGAFFF